MSLFPIVADPVANTPKVVGRLHLQRRYLDYLNAEAAKGKPIRVCISPNVEGASDITIFSATTEPAELAQIAELRALHLCRELLDAIKSGHVYVNDKSSAGEEPIVSQMAALLETVSDFGVATKPEEV